MPLRGSPEKRQRGSPSPRKRRRLDDDEDDAEAGDDRVPASRAPSPVPLYTRDVSLIWHASRFLTRVCRLGPRSCSGRIRTRANGAGCGQLDYAGWISKRSRQTTSMRQRKPRSLRSRRSPPRRRMRATRGMSAHRAAAGRTRDRRRTAVYEGGLGKRAGPRPGRPEVRRVRRRARAGAHRPARSRRARARGALPPELCLGYLANASSSGASGLRLRVLSPAVPVLLAAVRSGSCVTRACGALLRTGVSGSGRTRRRRKARSRGCGRGECEWVRPGLCGVCARGVGDKVCVPGPRDLRASSILTPDIAAVGR
ncbi:hypothetical protein B0H10DRAFT_414590 [Mycena sp. CBHHK59/15]|nr:hypothetical protein B0H10DRAFT_414590 [Mycena sp. CBHHK59/15]